MWARLGTTRVEPCKGLHSNFELSDLPTYIRLWWMWMAVANTLAYYDTAIINAFCIVKSQNRTILIDMDTLLLCSLVESVILALEIGEFHGWGNHQQCRYGSMTRGQMDYEIILNCVRKLMKNKAEKEDGKGPSFKKKFQWSRSILRSIVNKINLTVFGEFRTFSTFLMRCRD